MNKYLWLHIRKAGGTSLKEILGPSYAVSEWKYGTPFVALDKSQWNNNLNNHLVSLGEYEYKRMLFAQKFLYTEQEFAEMYKFAIVRNPYFRAVSCWKYLTKHWTLTKPRLMMAKRSFPYFLDMLPEFWETRFDRHVSTHTAPMWQDITDEHGTVLLDDVFKLENIHNDIVTICDKLGVEQHALKKKNSSNINNYDEYLTPKNIARIEGLYHEDIEHFGYTPK
ncbi:hypothetical protein ST37_08230 [Vibrio sp. qd031]|uniref:sulfotransferase family 2 domain-containing protein n=1 Tax=Vibrio sp. qd031 TaxID=1603038 RepID=UPI000A0F9E45|nr:sulfotransferase family 2 domain-containing protein [Vibrio sp. qd031]ORT50697.1 hypothetical protein ST37_08230 [Vibrio sp. qd031]